MPIQVILVDDHLLVREGVRMLLQQDDEIEVTGTYGNIHDAIAAIAATTPDVILLDLNLGKESSLKHLDRITAASPTSRILILTGLLNEDANWRVLTAGAKGIVLKDSAVETLLSAIKKVHRGEMWFDHAFIAKVVCEMNLYDRRGNRHRPLDTLTPRERQIVTLIAEGLVNKDIGSRLSVTEKTVRNALTVIYDKLGVTNRLELALFASRSLAPE